MTEKNYNPFCKINLELQSIRSIKHPWCLSKFLLQIPKIALSFPSYKYCEVPRVHPLKIKIDDDTKKYSKQSFSVVLLTKFKHELCSHTRIALRMTFLAVGFSCENVSSVTTRKLVLKQEKKIKEKTQGAEFKILIVL